MKMPRYDYPGLLKRIHGVPMDDSGMPVLEPCPLCHAPNPYFGMLEPYEDPFSGEEKHQASVYCSCGITLWHEGATPEQALEWALRRWNLRGEHSQEELERLLPYG